MNMTKALLMCMPDIYQTWHETHIKGPWLGGASIAGNCSEHEVYVADLVLKRNDVRGGVKEAIAKTTPQVVGLSAMTFHPNSSKNCGLYKKELSQNTNCSRRISRNSIKRRNSRIRRRASL